jgi:putative transcriptional regulator
MPIIIRLDRVLADRKISQNTLAKEIGLAPMNVSRIKTGNIKALRLETLERLCETLQCQPGDLLEYMTEEDALARGYDIRKNK